MCPSSLKRLLLMAALAVAMAGCGASGDAGLDLAGPWEVITADDPAAARPEYAGAPAGTVALPGDWRALQPLNDDLAATVWLRRRVVVPPALRGQLLVLALGRIAVADETYVNGTMVGGEGRIPSPADHLRYDFAWQTERSYRVPPNLIPPTGEVVIAIRVFSHVVSGVSGHLFLAGYSTGERGSLIKVMAADLMNLGALVLNLVLIFFYIITLDWRTRRAEIIFACLLLVSASATHLLMLGVPAIDGLLRFKLIIGLVLAAHFIFLSAVQEFMNLRVVKLYHFFMAVTVAIAGVIAASPTSRFLVDTAGLLTLLLIVLFVAYYTGLFAVKLYKDPLRYWVFLLAAVPLVFSTLWISWFFITGRVYAMPATISLHLPVALMAVMVVFILEFRNLKKENSSLTRNLLKVNWKMDELRKIVTRDRVKPGPRETVYDIIEFLDANYMEPYERIALAKRFSINEDYMMQVFKKTAGMPISRYINTRRIEAAKKLLRETDTKVIDIAYHVGFDNLTHFHRQFKDFTDCTPRQYRDSCSTRATDDAEPRRPAGVHDDVDDDE